MKYWVLKRTYYTLQTLRWGRCQCKHQPTPIPPKHCKELEGKICHEDEECGDGGYCSPFE